MSEAKCFICRKYLPKPADGEGALDSNWRYDCPRCGWVYITDSVASSQADPKIKEKWHLLSGILRWRKINGIKNYPIIKTDNLEETLSNPLIPERLTDKFDLFHLYLGRATPSVGSLIGINPDEDYPVTFSKSSREFSEIVKQFVEKENYLESEAGAYKLTRQGLSRYYDLEKKGISSKQCFVAMNFDNAYDLTYEKIKEAVEHCGFEAYRVKNVQHNDDVTDLIIAGIKKSRFLIADFTEQREGVYFEAGFARGLGRTVIWTCKESDKNNIHFDTDHFAHIFWKDEEDLKRQLVARIEATIN